MGATMVKSKWRILVAAMGITTISMMGGITPLASQQWHPSYSLPNALTATVGTPVEVYRGRLGGNVPSWVEIADLGTGHYVLSILDGVPGVQDRPARFRLVSNGKKGSGCILSNGAAIRIEGCPTGKAASLKFNLNGLKASAQMQPIGVAAAYGYNGQAGNAGNRTASAQISELCTLATLADASSLRNSAVPQAIAQLRVALAAAQASGPTALRVEELRQSRTSAYGALTYSQYELERLKRFELDPSRMFDFRMQMRMAEQRNRYLQEIDNTPQRNQARIRLADAEAQLAAIYDPARARAGGNALRALASGNLLPAVDEAVAARLATAPALDEDQLFLVEMGVNGMQACSGALSAATGLPGPAFEAPTALAGNFRRLAETVEFDFANLAESGATSEKLTSALNRYTASKGLQQALVAAGKSQWPATAQSIIRTVAAREEQSRRAAADKAARERQMLADAAAAKERARMTISTSGANAPTDADILAEYTNAMWSNTTNAMGNIGVRPVPGQPFQLRAFGSLGGELFRVRFDIGNKQCTRTAPASYRCSFNILNQFSNARDGSFESAMMGLSDGIFGLLAGKDVEGLTGRIQSNNINRLLLDEKVPMTVNFTFRNGKFHSQELRQKVWGQTLFYLR